MQQFDDTTMDVDLYRRRMTFVKRAIVAMAVALAVSLGVVWWAVGPVVAVVAAGWGVFVLTFYYLSSARQWRRRSMRGSDTEGFAPPAPTGQATPETTLSAASAMVDLDVALVRSVRADRGDQAAMTEIHRQRPALSSAAVAEMLRML